MRKKQLLFTHKGRISRKNFWRGYALSFLYFLLPVMIIYSAFGALTVVDTGLEGNSYQDPEMPFWYIALTSRTGKIIASLISFPLLGLYVYSSSCFFVKRLHDINLSGWFSLYRFAPLLFIFSLSAFSYFSLAGSCLSIALGIIKGKPGANKYGDDPLLLQ